MIKISNLEKIYRTEDVETVALNKLTFRSKGRRVCSCNGTIGLWQVNTIEYCGTPG
jgi:putative ABC transport system ATP-binding protein